MCRSRRTPKSSVDTIDTPPPTAEDEEGKKVILEVPFALQAKLKEEIDRLESEGIIESFEAYRMG